MNQTQLNASISQGHVFNYNQINKDQYMVDQENDLSGIQGKNIAVASAVTSYARMELYNLIVDLKAKNHQVIYYDTDSVITSCNLK